jgi:hypothetical protein
MPGVMFDLMDVEKVELNDDRYDVCTILNALYLAGLDVVGVLKKAFAALKPGGKIVVSGPLSPQSFQLALPQMRSQLESAGLLPKYEDIFKDVVSANRRLLSPDGNYWSPEGMVALLRHIGFGKCLEANTKLYYGNSYLVVMQKGE